MRQRAFLFCKSCGKKFFVPPSAIRSGRKNCGKSCYNKRGASNPKWRGGIVLVKGRKMIYMPNHPNATWGKNGSHVLEHRYVMSQHMGRPLKTAEIVHHVNGDKSDNRLENLQLMSQAEHARLHKESQRVLTQVQSRQVKVMRESGMTFVAIAKHFKCSVRTVRSHYGGHVIFGN